MATKLRKNRSVPPRLGLRIEPPVRKKRPAPRKDSRLADREGDEAISMIIDSRDGGELSGGYTGPNVFYNFVLVVRQKDGTEARIAVTRDDLKDLYQHLAPAPPQAPCPFCGRPAPPRFPPCPYRPMYPRMPYRSGPGRPMA